MRTYLYTHFIDTTKTRTQRVRTKKITCISMVVCVYLTQGVRYRSKWWWMCVSFFLLSFILRHLILVVVFRHHTLQNKPKTIERCRFFKLDFVIVSVWLFLPFPVSIALHNRIPLHLQWYHSLSFVTIGAVY